MGTWRDISVDNNQILFLERTDRKQNCLRQSSRVLQGNGRKALLSSFQEQIIFEGRLSVTMSNVKELYGI